MSECDCGRVENGRHHTDCPASGNSIRKEQAHNEGQNAALKEIARWLGHDTATFASVRKWIDEIRSRAERAEDQLAAYHGEGESMSNYAPGGPKFGKVCKHAILERSCDECHDTLGTKAQLATLIREVAASRIWFATRVKPQSDRTPEELAVTTLALEKVKANTDANPYLQARIAREMESK